MLNIKELKQANEIKICMKDKSGYFVVDHKLTSFKLDEIEDVEVVQYILENGEQVLFPFDIFVKNGNVFEYNIHNGGEYEFAAHTSLYSYLYFNDEEFETMCQKAQESIRAEINTNKDSRLRENSIYDISRYLEKLYPDTFIKIGRGSSFCSNEWPSD